MSVAPAAWITSEGWSACASDMADATSGNGTLGPGRSPHRDRLEWRHREVIIRRRPHQERPRPRRPQVREAEPALLDPRWVLGADGLGGGAQVVPGDARRQVVDQVDVDVEPER